MESAQTNNRLPSSPSPLKEWASSYLSLPRNDDFKRSTLAKTGLPRILLLDGGVSTHLEKKLRHEQSRASETFGTSNLSPSVESTTPEPVFSHRSLWSSSLLLTQNGQDAIQSCHQDFFLAGSDIASTVTYQCHYLVCRRDEEADTAHCDEKTHN